MSGEGAPHAADSTGEEARLLGPSQMEKSTAKDAPSHGIRSHLGRRCEGTHPIRPHAVKDTESRPSVRRMQSRCEGEQFGIVPRITWRFVSRRNQALQRADADRR